LYGTNNVEEVAVNILKEINDHHNDESNVRLSISKVRQKIAAVNLELIAQKSHCEAVTGLQKSKVQKEIESSKIQLKQLLISEEVLLNRMKELQQDKNTLRQKIRRNFTLDDNWTTILTTQLEHKKGLTLQIPIEGDASYSDTDKLAELQLKDIEKLKKQLAMRDKIIEDSGKVADLATRSDLLSFNEVLKTVENTKLKDQVPGPTFGHSTQDRLFMKVNRVGYSKGGYHYTEQKKSDREKRNYSMASQNSSFSTGASSGAVPGLLKPINPLSKDSIRSSVKNNKINQRELVNAGTRIIIGPTKSLLNTDKLPLIAASEVKESKPKLPKLRPSRFILERPRFVYENKVTSH